MFSWFKKRILGGVERNGEQATEEPCDIEVPVLVRLSVKKIPCEVCAGPLEDGDVLVRYDSRRGAPGSPVEGRRTVSQRLVLAHVDCLVLIRGEHDPATPAHRKSILLSQGEYDDWLKGDIVPMMTAEE